MRALYLAMFWVLACPLFAFAGPVRVLVEEGHPSDVTFDTFTLELSPGSHGPFECSSVNAGSGAVTVGTLGGSLLVSETSSTYLPNVPVLESSPAAVYSLMQLGVLLFLIFALSFKLS